MKTWVKVRRDYCLDNRHIKEQNRRGRVGEERDFVFLFCIILYRLIFLKGMITWNYTTKNKTKTNVAQTRGAI